MLQNKALNDHQALTFLFSQVFGVFMSVIFMLYSIKSHKTECNWKNLWIDQVRLGLILKSRQTTQFNFSGILAHAVFDLTYGHCLFVATE